MAVLLRFSEMHIAILRAFAVSNYSETIQKDAAHVVYNSRIYSQVKTILHILI